MKKINLILIDGLNGAGKSTTAQLLHSKLKRTSLISYDKIKRLISDFAPNEECHAIANYVVRAMAKEYIDHGINVIIESYIPTEQIANRYLSLAKRKDVKLFYYQLEAPLRIRAKRIKQRPLAEGAKKKMTLEHIQRNDKFYLANKYSKALVIQTHNLTPVQVVRLILKDIASGSVKVEDKESKYKPKFVKDVFSGIREKATFEYKGRGSFLRQLRKIGTKRSV